MSKKLFAIVAFVFVVFTPLYGQAQNFSQTQNLQEIIKTLQEQIKSLQKQIVILQTQLESTKEEVAEVKVELKITRSLRFGANGDDVKELQKFLKQFPDIYPEGLVTGYFGSLTEIAVKKLQERQGIETKGIVGPKTLFKINELLSQGAGVSGMIPSGLLTAPGIQKKLGDATSTPPIATSTSPAASSTPPQTTSTPPVATSTPPIATSTQTTPIGGVFPPPLGTSTSTSYTSTNTAASSSATTTNQGTGTPPSATAYAVCGQSVKSVPGSYPNIQAAINAANLGDTVRVAAGTYTENLTMKSGVCLEGAGIDQTIIAKSGASGITVDSVSYVIIKNLTVKNSGCQPGPCGGGGEGGGIRVSGSRDIVLESCHLTENAVVNGGGMIVYGSNITMSRCLIDHNSAGNIGGGIVVEGASTASFTNVTVANNAGNVGGISFYGSNLQINNSILWGNTSPNFSAQYASANNGIYSVSYSDIGGWSGGTSNINADPQFASATDYHLQSTSPVINAGNPSTYDPDGSRADMGAYPFTGTISAPSGGSSNSSTTTTTTSLATSTPSVDITPPIISSVQKTDITTSSATISWVTDEPASSEIMYGTDPNFIIGTGWGDPTLVMSHSKTFNGLSPNAVYYFKVTSRDVAGNATTSASYTFTTAASAPSVSIAVTYPNGGETWTTGQSYPITWNSTGNINGVLLFLANEVGAVFITNLVNVNGNPGTTTWGVPTWLGQGRYKMLIHGCSAQNCTVGNTKSTESSVVNDLSDSAFNVVAPATSTSAMAQGDIASMLQSLTSLLQTIQELLR